MRKVILQEFVTLNGFASGPNGSVDFVPASTSGDQRFGRDQVALFDAIDTIWGSLSLAQSLIREKLIDGFRLVVCPLVLGSGRRLFSDDLSTLEMSLIEANRWIAVRFP